MVSLETHRFDNLDMDYALRLILEGTAAETGKQFYAALVENLAKTLNTTGAWITEYLEEAQRLRALAFWFNGERVEDYEYNITGSPCESVIKSAKFIHIPENVTQLFPNDPDLRAFNAVSYMGVPLKDRNGRILGHLAVMDSRPLPEEPRLYTLFGIFSARAAAEHQRLHAEAGIHEREEKLSRLIGSLMDAVIELDEELNITLVNAAAEKTFDSIQEKLVGQNFRQFLTTKDLAKLTRLIQELQTRQEGQQHLWIPGGFKVMCAGGKEFSAEATLSVSRLNRQKFYTLILRNVNERLKAEQKINQLTEEAEYLKEEIKRIHNFDEIIGQSEPMLDVLRDVERVAQADTTVLILGETGTGKELIARAIHNASPRRDKPLITVNCAAIPAHLIESEFFGHEKGAFTGAVSRRKGRFSLADGGTIFLDEVAELSFDLQAKLLRVLQEGEFEPIGSTQTVKVDVRVVAATNRDLQKAVKESGFREDLFYRLNVFPLTLPPLRLRGDDIAMLANAFLKRFTQKMGRTIGPLTDEHIQRLKAYDWPGNVRELENVIERAVIIADGNQLNLDRALPRPAQEQVRVTVPQPQGSGVSIRTVEELQELERQNLIAALESCGWQVAGENGAAKLLGMKPSTLSSRMKALTIKKA